MLLELVGGTQQGRSIAGKRELLALIEFRGTIFTSSRFQRGLVIEEIQMRRRARHMQVNHVLCFTRKVWRFGY